MKNNKRVIESNAEAISLSPELRVLVERFQKIQQYAREQGIFINDREFLECSKCHLMEDIAFNGRLFTYKRDDADFKDTGLMFIELDKNNNLFKCPNCNTEILVPKERE